jgi:hypothetical protein
MLVKSTFETSFGVTKMRFMYFWSQLFSNKLRKTKITFKNQQLASLTLIDVRNMRESVVQWLM